MRLKKSNLEILLKAVSSKGADPGKCVTIPSLTTCAGLAPNVLMCQLFRWPDLQSDFTLKKLPICTEIVSKEVFPLYQCCNPYHWSKIQPIEEHLGKKIGNFYLFFGLKWS